MTMKRYKIRIGNERVVFFDDLASAVAFVENWKKHTGARLTIEYPDKVIIGRAL
jgi:hypothetical protein